MRIYQWLGRVVSRKPPDTDSTQEWMITNLKMLRIAKMLGRININSQNVLACRNKATDRQYMYVISILSNPEDLCLYPESQRHRYTVVTVDRGHWPTMAAEDLSSSTVFEKNEKLRTDVKPGNT